MFNEYDNFQCQEEKNQILEKFLKNTNDNLNLIGVEYIDFLDYNEENLNDNLLNCSIYGSYNPPNEKELIEVDKIFSLEAYLYRIIKKMKVAQIKKVHNNNFR